MLTKYIGDSARIGKQHKKISLVWDKNPTRFSSAKNFRNIDFLSLPSAADIPLKRLSFHYGSWGLGRDTQTN